MIQRGSALLLTYPDTFHEPSVDPVDHGRLKPRPNPEALPAKISLAKKLCDLLTPLFIWNNT